LGTSMNGGNASGPGRPRPSLMGRKDCEFDHYYYLSLLPALFFGLGLLL
jgi:hypothetical protein